MLYFQLVKMILVFSPIQSLKVNTHIFTCINKWLIHRCSKSGVVVGSFFIIAWNQVLFHHCWKHFAAALRLLRRWSKLVATAWLFYIVVGLSKGNFNSETSYFFVNQKTFFFYIFYFLHIFCILFIDLVESQKKLR